MSWFVRTPAMSAEVLDSLLGRASRGGREQESEQADAECSEHRRDQSGHRTLPKNRLSQPCLEALATWPVPP